MELATGEPQLLPRGWRIWSKARTQSMFVYLTEHKCELDGFTVLNSSIVPKHRCDFCNKQNALSCVDKYGSLAIFFSFLAADLGPGHGNVGLTMENEAEMRERERSDWLLKEEQRLFQRQQKLQAVGPMSLPTYHHTW